MEKLEKDVLSLISEDSRLTTERVAAMLGTDADTVKRIISRLEQDGVIVKYTAILNTDSVEIGRAHV